MKLYIIKRLTYLIISLINIACITYALYFLYFGIVIAELSDSDAQSAQNEFKVVSARTHKDQNLEYMQLNEAYLENILRYIDARGGQKSIIDADKLNKLLK